MRAVFLAGAFLLASASARAAVSEAEIPGIVNTIIQAESSGRAWVVGDGGKARGLMQIQRPTWERYTTESWDKAFDPAVNRAVGTKIVRSLVKTYGPRATEALVIYSYNTGRIAKSGLPAWTAKHPNKIYRNIFNK